MAELAAVAGQLHNIEKNPKSKSTRPCLKPDVSPCRALPYNQLILGLVELIVPDLHYYSLNETEHTAYLDIVQLSFILRGPAARPPPRCPLCRGWQPVRQPPPPSHPPTHALQCPESHMPNINGQPQPTQPQKSRER